MGRILKYQATASDTGRAVREILRDEFCLVAHDIARAKYRTEKGIAVNGVSVKTDRVLREGDVVEFLLLGEPSLRTVPVRGEIRILYEDEDLICLDKPAGLVVHPSHGHFADSLGNYLASYFEEKGEPHEIRTVGRLDKDTSGVICFGKSRTACALMMGQGTSSYRPAPSRKQYLALSRGRFPQTCGTVDAPISREYEEKIRRVVRSDGAPARTHYRVLKQYGDFALLLLELETGRTHQIRVHMAHIGHPLLGDPIYGGETDPAAERGLLQRAALHAWRLTFEQPFDRRLITVTAPLPADMRDIIKKLK